METTHHVYSSQRGIAMVLALVSAVVLSPLYIDRKFEYRNEKRWNTGFLLPPMILAGLIVGIRTASSSSSTYRGNRSNTLSSSSFLLTIGNSSWGLAAILIALMFILSCQSSVQQFFWR